MTVTEPTAKAVETPKPKKANPNALLLFYRKYHGWFGVFAAGFVVMIAITGIYLNHKDTFRSLLGGVAKEEEEHKGPSGRVGLPTSAEIAALPVSMSRAVELATPHLTDRPIERIELRPENGRLVYKIKAVGGPEAVIDANTSALEIKGEKEKMESKPMPMKGGERAERGEKGEKGSKPPRPKKESAGEDAATATALPVTPPPKGMDWGKAIKDLHTGKIAGDAGKLLIDLVALILIALTLTGLYLWAVPILRKRRSARQRAGAAAPVAT